MAHLLSESWMKNELCRGRQDKNDKKLLAMMKHKKEIGSWVIYEGGFPFICI